MDLQDQLRKFFPDHVPTADEEVVEENELRMQQEEIICKFEKRNGKPHTILEVVNGSDENLKLLSKEIKKLLGVGGSYKEGKIIIQGNYRDKIMQFLKDKGFKVKRVGG